MMLMEFEFNKTPTVCADGRNNYTFYEDKIFSISSNTKYYYYLK